MYFLALALLCVFVEGFFSMFEMACVSLNKVRIQFYVSKNNQRAKWLQKLLNNPSFLFGTTLITVNTVMQIGSESARRFYDFLNLNPDYAPITQILLVVIFGELAPLFAARRHPENVAFIFIPIVYLISKILTPFIWIIDKVSKISNYIFGKSQVAFFLSKEELQKAFEEPQKKSSVIDRESINTIVGNIFSLKDITAKQIMQRLDHIKMVEANSTIKEMMTTLSVNYSSYIPVYHKERQNIVSIAYPRDLLTCDEDSIILNYAKPVWFITESVSIVDVLKQFRTNNQYVAIVLNKQGKAKGFVTLDQIVDEIFGEYPQKKETKEENKVLVEKTISGDMTLEDFNNEFNSDLQYKNTKTLSEFLTAIIDHHPSEGEVVHFEGFEFTIMEPSLLGAKTIKVKTLH